MALKPYAPPIARGATWNYAVKIRDESTGDPIERAILESLDWRVEFFLPDPSSCAKYTVTDVAIPDDGQVEWSLTIPSCFWPGTYTVRLRASDGTSTYDYANIMLPVTP